ncbi:MAG: hypothetical protein IKN60_01890 [Bacteroidales bacterium]|nr:hypothetical protein [Bacteroidales bacterium]
MKIDYPQLREIGERYRFQFDHPVPIETYNLRKEPNYERLIQRMVAFSNVDGGIIILAFSRNNWVKHIENNDPLWSEWKLQLCIEERTRNLGHREVHEEQHFDSTLIIIIVRRTTRGYAYTFSSKLPHIRSFYFYGRETILAKYPRVYKYMTLDAFIASMESRTWRFYEPIHWNDKYERRFYCANYQNVTNNPADTPMLYATCVTKTRNSEAAWKVYAGREGLKSHCVQLELDIVEMLYQLQLSNFSIYEKSIQYKRDQYIDTLHKNTAPDYPIYFHGFGFDSFLNLLSLKRDAYSYENELRFFAVPEVLEPRSTKDGRGHDFDFAWKDVVKSIRIDSSCSDSELYAFRHSCWAAGIDPIIAGKTLRGTYLGNPLTLRQVDVELFDIDEMHLGGTITIDLP